METKFITKTIKELADELDGNVDQLHREIGRYEKVHGWDKKEIEMLRYEIRVEILARERAEKISDTSIFVMFFCVVVMFSITTYNYLFL